MFDVLIIGAGISGLTAALTLKEKGNKVAVFDKGNGVGGRTATRKLTIAEKDYAFDYGCSGFELNDQNVRKSLSHFMSEENFPTVEKGQNGWFFKNGMRSFAEWMAESVTKDSGDSKIISRTKISSVRFDDQTWTVSDGSKDWKGRHLIITAPAPQTVDLLNNSGVHTSILTNLNAIRYQPSWVALTTSEREIPSELLAQFIHFDPDLISVVDNHRRGVSNGFAYNFHYANSWSRDYLEATFHQVEYDFIRRWNRKMNAYPLQTIKAHRWRYAFPIVPSSLKGTILSDKDIHLSYGSDALFSPDIQGAMQAGLVLSDQF
jgi:predicted NAD/FAD-dependent oxidoreductase